MFPALSLSHTHTCQLFFFLCFNFLHHPARLVCLFVCLFFLTSFSLSLLAAAAAADANVIFCYLAFIPLLLGTVGCSLKLAQIILCLFALQLDLQAAISPIDVVVSSSTNKHIYLSLTVTQFLGHLRCNNILHHFHHQRRERERREVSS